MDERTNRAGRLAIAVAAVLLLAAVVWVRPAFAAPVGFDEVDVATGFTRPTSVVWAPDGRMFVAEQRGRVVVVAPGATTPTVLLDLSSRVNSFGDRGLMSIALDRDFAENRWMYLLYVKEMAPAKPDATNDAVSVLTRVTVPDTGPILGPETEILGTQSDALCPPGMDGSVDCIPSDFRWHAVGTVRSDPRDGTLWVSVGDSKDPKDKSEAKMRRPLDEDSPIGKILHVARDGRGLPGHAFCPGVTDLSQWCTKVYAKGFRNPFRFHLRPGGKGPVVGDVGDNTREEVDLVQQGRSYGWPCFEGTIRHPSYQAEPYCQSVYAAGGQTPPLWDYPHLSGQGDSITVGPMMTGTRYPAEYAGDVFIADYGQGWIKRLKVDAQDRLVGTGPVAFAEPWCCAVDLALTPDGELATVGIGINAGEGPAKIRRFTYTAGGNRAPVARATATPATGGPREVTFDASGSSDPDGDDLTYTWRFADGTEQTGRVVKRTFTARGTHTVQLLVRDAAHPDPQIATVTVTVGTPPTATVLAPVDGALFRAGRPVALRGAASGAQTAVTYAWDVRLIHKGHAHSLLETAPGDDPTATFTPAADHDADSSYEIRLTTKDADGLATTQLVTVRPETRRLTLASSPAGAPLQYFPGAMAPAPLGVDALIGYRATIAAAPTFTRGGVLHRFTGWSDGGARQHDVTVPAEATTLTATYCPTAAGAPDRCAAAAPGTTPRPGGGTGGGGTGTSTAGDRTRPVVSALRLGARTFARSTTLRLRLSEAARVRVTVRRALRGRRAGSRCVAPSRAARDARPCTRLVAVPGALARSLAAGPAAVRLSRTFAGRRLRPGRHRLAVVATDAAGNRSRAVRATFTVRR